MHKLLAAIFLAGCSGTVTAPVTAPVIPSSVGDEARDSSVGSLADLAMDGAPSAADFASQSSSVSSFGEVPSFGSNPGALKMYAYVPANMPVNAGIVLALPGCGMTAADYLGAGWNELADLSHFYVVYAEQQIANNALRCFDWVNAANTTRDQGEAFSIKQMIDYMKANYSIDAHRVFVTGLSGGGGMTSVMLADYPDVFSGGAIMAGLPFQCATNTIASLACTSTGVSHTASEWGDLVRAAFVGYAGPYPRVSIWQGSSDTLVNPTNMNELVKQWTNANGIDQIADATDQLDGATHAEYQDGSSHTLVESYSIPSMGHGTAIAVGFQPAGGCGVAGSFILDVGICSTYYAAQFFGL